MTTGLSVLYMYAVEEKEKCWKASTVIARRDRARISRRCVKLSSSRSDVVLKSTARGDSRGEVGEVLVSCRTTAPLTANVRPPSLPSCLWRAATAMPAAATAPTPPPVSSVIMTKVLISDADLAWQHNQGGFVGHDHRRAAMWPSASGQPDRRHPRQQRCRRDRIEDARMILSG